MSLEDALQKNTDAVNALTAALISMTLAGSTTAVAMSAAAYVATLDKPVAAYAATLDQVESKPADKVKTVKADAVKADAEKVESPKPAPTPDVTTVNAPATDAKASPSEPATFTYDDVKALVLRVSKEKGRDTAAAVLNGLGVAKAPELKLEQYAAAVKQLEAALA